MITKISIKKAQPPMTCSNLQNEVVGGKLHHCDPCKRDFGDEKALSSHQEKHSKCEEKGCDFIASNNALKLHFVQVHQEGKFRIVLDTAEDIEKWRKERKRAWPTPDNIEAKKRKLEQDKEDGIVVETKEFTYREPGGGKADRGGRGRGKGKGKGRGRDRRPDGIQSREPTTGGRGRGGRQNNNKHNNVDKSEVEPSHEIPVAETNNRDENKITDEPAVSSDISASDGDNIPFIGKPIGDNIPFIGKPVGDNIPFIGEPVSDTVIAATDAEKNEAVDATSDSSFHTNPSPAEATDENGLKLPSNVDKEDGELDSEDECENVNPSNNIEMNVDLQQTTSELSSETTGDTATGETTTGDLTTGDQGVEDGDKENKMDDSTCVVKSVNENVKEKGENVDGENNDPQNRKRKHGKNKQNKKDKTFGDMQNQPGKKVSLLEMLLANEIRHERNIMLQCIRYIVRQNFLLDS